MKLFEIIGKSGEVQHKLAGLVPFIADGRCLFTGDAVPEIAKAMVEGDEDGKQVAAKTIGSKLFADPGAMMAANPFLGWSGTIDGKQAYEFDVYAVLVKGTDVKTGNWLSSSEFLTRSTKAQAQIMTKVFDKIEVYLKK